MLGEKVGDDEINSKCVCVWLLAMIKIAGVKSNDKINFKEFCDFFYKVDWPNGVYAPSVLECSLVLC